VIVMERVAGQTLSAAIGPLGLPIARVLEIAVPIAAELRGRLEDLLDDLIRPDRAGREPHASDTSGRRLVPPRLAERPEDFRKLEQAHRKGGPRAARLSRARRLHAAALGASQRIGIPTAVPSG
jgi:hypothetical protein